MNGQFFLIFRWHCFLCNLLEINKVAKFRQLKGGGKNSSFSDTDWLKEKKRDVSQK